MFWENRSELLTQLGYTAKVALLGALLGSFTGLIIGYPMARLRWLERFLSPLLIASQSTPTVVLAPLLLLWLGFGVLPGILVSALTAFYPVLVSTLVGVREVDATYQELFSAVRATPVQRFLHLELPGALPVLLGGLRLSLSLALDRSGGLGIYQQPAGAGLCHQPSAGLRPDAPDLRRDCPAGAAGRGPVQHRHLGRARGAAAAGR